MPCSAALYGLLGLALAGLTTCASPVLVFDDAEGQYLLAQEGTAPTIWVDSNEPKAVQRAAGDLGLDFGRVTGTNGTVTNTLADVGDSPLIIVGSLGHSSIVDGLVDDGRLDVSEIENGWENYILTLVENPTPDIAEAFFVIGSDRRGAIWGIYDISETIGVSPWYWWADVPSKSRSSIWATGNTKTQGDPSVKWRGIFINNEAPSLADWSARYFPQGEYGSYLGDEFYSLVFELLLRLKANYIWPAMWGKMFYLDTSNAGQVSDDYGIVVGTSHHEPMARSEAEQHRFVDGIWDWDTNRDAVSEFMREGVRRASNKETLYTVGMRGSGDAPNPALTPETLEEIVLHQQDLLREELNVTDLHEVPQAWVLYTEVGKYYQGGMQVPDSVTLLWADDNYGNLLRVPLSNETDHGAGHGVYFHFDFNGGIRCYKWINTIQMIKTWEQMQLAYEKGAREIWITNIGDIKPLEIPTHHFLDMAYDYSKHSTPDTVYTWLRDWAAKTFSEDVAEDTADILTTYGILTVRRKYELLSNLPFAWSTTNYDEAELILQEWYDLHEFTQSVHDRLSPEIQLPFFEMVLHPVLAGKTVIDLYIKAAFNRQYAYERRASTNDAAQAVQDLFAEDQQITNQYHSLLNGKWNGMVIQPHIGYFTWSDPPYNIPPSLTFYSGDSTGSPFAIAAQGNKTARPASTASLRLFTVDSYTPALDQRWFEIYTRDNATFSYQISTNASYISLPNTSGTIEAPGSTKQVRSVISVDWDAAPSGSSVAQIVVERSDVDDESITLELPIIKRSVPSDFHGYVESGGVVSMEVDRYANAEEKNGLSYIVLPGYGRTRAGLKTWPVTSGSQTPQTGPKVTYSFFTFSQAPRANLTVHLGTSINHDPSRQLKYAVSIDGSSPQTVQPVPNHAMGSLPNGHTPSTIAGGWSATSTFEVTAGAHELDVWLLEPGVVIQKLVLNLGGQRASAQGPFESVRV